MTEASAYSILPSQLSCHEQGLVGCAHRVSKAVVGGVGSAELLGTDQIVPIDRATDGSNNSSPNESSCMSLTADLNFL